MVGRAGDGRRRGELVHLGHGVRLGRVQPKRAVGAARAEHGLGGGRRQRRQRAPEVPVEQPARLGVLRQSVGVSEWIDRPREQNKWGR